MFGRGALVGALASLALSCGGAAPPVGDAMRIEARTVVAPGDSATSYATNASSGAPIGGADAAAVERGVARAASARGVSLTFDARLALLSAWTAERVRDDGLLPPREVLEFFARHLGLVEPVPHMFTVTQTRDRPLDDTVAEIVTARLGQTDYSVWGSTLVSRGELRLLVLVLGARFVELTPIPRRFAAGERLTLRGRLLGGYARPSVALQRPGGDVVQRPAGTDVSIDFETTLDTPGTYQVEVLGESTRGVTVLANFPIYVGVDPPTSITLAPVDNSPPASAAELESALFRLLNETRLAAGMPALERFGQVDAAARAHSQDMVAASYFGHVSPTTGTAADRVARVGVRTGLILENLGRGYSAREIHEALLASPGHRANILNPDVTHVGIGAISVPESRRMAHVVTQNFVRIAREIDTARAPAELLELINRARIARGAAPLTADERLGVAAASAATRFFAEPDVSEQDIVDDATGSLRRYAILYRRVGGLAAVVASLDEAASLEPALDASVTQAGIGVAQGSRPDTPSNSIVVVIVLAWRR